MANMQQEHIWNLVAKKFSCEASNAELHELEQLLRANPEIHYSMQTIMDLWCAESYSDIKESEEAFNKHLERMKKLEADFSFNEKNHIKKNFRPGIKNIEGKYLWLLLPTFLVMGIVFFFFQFSNRSSTDDKLKQLTKTVSEISTKNGSKTNLILPDGTKVWLNAGSRLSYDSAYGKNNREVTLSGEGFFDVITNKEKPFIIHASKIDIKVLGTAFNVKSYPTDKTIEASLIRGSIEVSFKNKSQKRLLLKPNEKIIVENDLSDENGILALASQSQIMNKMPAIMIKSLTREYKTGEVIETSWVDNRLIFQNESFENIAKQLERWYGVSIQFRNIQLKENHLTGSFKNETIGQALDALKLTASFNYSINPDNNIVIY